MVLNVLAETIATSVNPNSLGERLGNINFNANDGFSSVSPRQCSIVNAKDSSQVTSNGAEEVFIEKIDRNRRKTNPNGHYRGVRVEVEINRPSEEPKEVALYV